MLSLFLLQILKFLIDDLILALMPNEKKQRNKKILNSYHILYMAIKEFELIFNLMPKLSIKNIEKIKKEFLRIVDKDNKY